MSEENQKADEPLKVSLDGCVAPVNMIINLGSIKGDIYQHQSDTAPAGELKLEAGKGFGNFFREYRNTPVVTVMLALAVLETIPENLFTRICGLLDQSLDRTTTVKNEKETAGKYYSLTEILNIINAEMVNAVLKRNGMEMPIRCICYSEPDYAEWVRREIWSDYFEIKDAVAEWALNLREDAEIRNMIYYQIVNGIAALAGLDYVYAMERFISPIEKPWKADCISYVVRVLEELHDRPAYKDMVEQVMCQWLKRNEGYWRIAYQIYTPEVCEEWKKLLREKLVSVIEEDIAGLQRKSPEQQRQISRGYLIVPAHINLSAARLLALAVNDVFKKAAIHPEQELIIQYFLYLFMEDYHFTNDRYRKIALVDVCNDREVRIQIRPMLWHAWESKKNRDKIFCVIRPYLKEMTCEAEWKYMEQFILTLAFTGKPKAYQDMQNLLEQCKCEQAAAIVACLDRILRERMKKTNDKENI